MYFIATIDSKRYRCPCFELEFFKDVCSNVLVSGIRRNKERLQPCSPVAFSQKLICNYEQIFTQEKYRQIFTQGKRATFAETFLAYLCNKEALHIFKELMLNWEIENTLLLLTKWQLDYSNMTITAINNHEFSALYSQISIQIFITMLPKQWTRNNHSDLPTFNLPVTSPFELRAFTVTL